MQTPESLDELQSILLFLATSSVARAVHAIAAVEIFHTEVTNFTLALNNAIATDMGFCTALKPMSLSVVEFTAAVAEVTYFTIADAWLTVPIITAD